MTPDLSATGPRSSYGPQFIPADVAIFLIPVLILFAQEGTIVPLINQGLGVLLLLLYFAYQIVYRPRLIPEVWLFVGFTIWAGATGYVLGGQTPEFTSYFLRVARICGLLMAMAGIAQIKRSPTVNLAAVFVTAIYITLVARWMGVAIEAEYTASRDVSAWNANSVGSAMLSAIFALAYLWGMRNARLLRFLRPFMPLLLIVLATPLIYTMVAFASRKAFVALVAFVVLWMWFCYRRLVLKNLGAFILVMVVAASLVFLVIYVRGHSMLGARYEGTMDWRDTGTAKRIDMYAAAFKFLRDYPLTGVGLGGFERLAGFDAYSHSDYAEVLATTGLVGAALYLPIYLIWWRRLRRIERATDDPEIKYHVGLFKAILLVLLGLGLGVPNFLQTEQWYWLAAIIGYSRALELDLIPRRPK
jgi:O-antigen ligase